jgi:hypothetical protein
MKNTARFLICITLLILYLCSASYANGKGGGGGSKPRYYSFEDLRSKMKGYTFRFENASKPSSAMASLSYYLDYPMVASKNSKIKTAVAATPTKYNADGMHLSANWNDAVETQINWNDFKNTLEGDILFTRGNGKLPDFVKIFSNWTHVGIVYNPSLLSVFESTLDTGVNLNYAPKTNTNVTYYTFRRVETVPYSFRQNLVEVAKDRFKGIPYLPKVDVSEPILNFILKWCNKDDMSSMYCSKLVYNTFKPYINMDTERTVVDSFDLGRPIGGFFFSWIGVSPDDIYYSPGLGSDFYFSKNMYNL